MADTLSASSQLHCAQSFPKPANLEIRTGTVVGDVESSVPTDVEILEM